MDTQDRQTLDSLVSKYSLKEERVQVGDTQQWRLTLPKLVFISYEDRVTLKELGFYAPGRAKTWYKRSKKLRP